MNLDLASLLRRIRQNWKWLVPVIALTAIVGGGSIAAVAIGILRSSKPVELTVTQLERSRQSVELIGKPVKVGWVVTGDISGGSSGRASLEIPVSGPEGEGVAFVEAVKAEGRWHILKLYLVAKGERLTIVGREKGQY